LCGPTSKGSTARCLGKPIALAIAALIYFLSPIDLIPDPLPVVSYIDDVAVIGFVVASIYTDLNNFRGWKESRRAA
jgi:uncharacterized membrane protein YkvA (DUF1232 family)